MKATALIAEDEPLLALALQRALAEAWPGLQVLATVGDGLQAVEQALALQPDVLFFDIRMPGQSGLEAAAELADAWPAQGPRPFPALVFVTAYDRYALDAFEAQAVDYLVKPVERPRLARCVQRLQTLLTPAQGGHAEPAPAGPTPPAAADGFAPTPQQLQQLAALLAQAAPASPTPPKLRFIQASTSTGALVLVPVDEVLYVEAADKYLRVVAPQREVLIRTPLKELLPQLDPQRFWQVHRGTVVRADAIARVQRDEAGRLWLTLHDRPERLAVSRLHAHQFKPM